MQITKQKLPLQYVKVTDIEINWKDYPEFCDSYIISAEVFGRECTEEEIEEMNDNSEFIYDEIMRRLY